MTMIASAIFVMMIAAVSAGLYLLPTLIGWARHVPHIGSVAAVNILLGWTLAGWAVALAMALRSASAPLVQVVQNLPPGQPPASSALPPSGAAPHRPGRPSRPASPSRPARPSGPAAPARPASQAPPLILPPRQPRGTLRRPGEPSDPGGADGQDVG